MKKSNKKIVVEFEKFKETINEQNINGYHTIAGTLKYGLVIIHNTYRVENYKGVFKKEVPYIEIPKELADEFIGYLINYRDLELTKTEGKSEFDKYCDNMFDEEHTELYL